MESLSVPILSGFLQKSTELLVCVFTVPERMLAPRGAVVVRVAQRQWLAQGRPYTKSVPVFKEPTLHNATGKWDMLKAQRPIDADDQHVRAYITENSRFHK
jgi:hypothetical protein